MNAQDLLRVMPFAKSRVELYAPLITAAWSEFAINSPKRQAAWLAQIGWESGQLRYTEELGKESDFIKYEGRADLGNTELGDGAKFKGHGLIQITGRANHAACGAALGLDLITNPRLLTEPIHATRSAAWFWASRGLNELADADRFGAITKRINGGYTHLDERIALWLAARRVLGI